MSRRGYIATILRVLGVYSLDVRLPLFIILVIFSPNTRAGLLEQFGCEAVLAQTNPVSSNYVLRNDRITVKAGRKYFYIYDRQNPGVFFATADLDNRGGLVLNLQLRNTQQFDGTPERSPYLHGREIFDAIMEHFEGRIKTINGAWTSGDNRDRFNQLRVDGASEAEAAAGTWTGTQAARYGFTRIVVTMTKPDEARHPPYNHVRAKFYPAIKAK